LAVPSGGGLRGYGVGIDVNKRGRKERI